MSTRFMLAVVATCSILSSLCFTAAGYWITIHPPCAYSQRLCPGAR